MSARRRTDCPSSCRRKTAHPTEAEARRHAEALAVAMPYAKVRVYKCRFCGRWFVTSEPRRVKRKH